MVEQYGADAADGLIYGTSPGRDLLISPDKVVACVILPNLNATDLF